MSRRILAILTAMAMLAVMLPATALAVDTPTYTENWDGRGTDSERCDLIGQEGRTAAGWIHWVFSTKGDSTDAKLVLGGTGSGEYDPGAPLNADVWHFYTPYFDLEGLTATIYLYGGLPGEGGGLVISDFCPGGEQLDVSKTADTSFRRAHDWSIDKSVLPEEIWLYVDGSGDQTVEWTVVVTYEGYEDSEHNVSGEITIENVGGLDAVITDVDDVLAGEAIDVDCGVTFPYTLVVGDTLTCTYSEDVDGEIEGKNEVTVTTERDEYEAEADIVWDGPTIEAHAKVKVVDNSDLFGKVKLGKLLAANMDEGDTETFTYDKLFSWADYGRDDCGDFSYDNTARVLGDNRTVLDEADATLDVHVQCEIFEGETAWAANGDTPLQLRYTPRGNWATYVQYDGEKTTTLFAGQTIDVGTVHFSAAAGGEVTITVNLTGSWEFEDVSENLKVQDYDSAPSGNPSPGQFDHKKTCDATESSCSIVVPENNFYGVHVLVGTWIPDPNFGP
jgi:hypothetical protein